MEDGVDELARRARDGDALALEELLVVVRPRVLRVCRGVLPHLPDAEDAAQDAMVAVLTKLGTWRGDAAFTTWLHVVALNAARSTYRRLKQQSARSLDPVEEDGRDVPPDPRTTSVIAGTRLDLLEALETLEKRHERLVAPLVLRDVYDLTYDDIARHLDLPLGTLKSQIHRARKVVQDELDARRSAR